MYTVYGVLFSHLWRKSVPGWPAISVSTSQLFRVGQIVWREQGGGLRSHSPWVQLFGVGSAEQVNEQQIKVLHITWLFL
jgi:hypothetical protein